LYPYKKPLSMIKKLTPQAALYVKFIKWYAFECKIKILRKAKNLRN
jgi:hypothetical protein